MKYIRDRGMKATKIFATLMALGVVASAIFGMTQAGKDLVDKTLYTVGLYTVCSVQLKRFLSQICCADQASGPDSLDCRSGTPASAVPCMFGWHWHVIA